MLIQVFESSTTNKLRRRWIDEQPRRLVCVWEMFGSFRIDNIAENLGNRTFHICSTWALEFIKPCIYTIFYIHIFLYSHAESRNSEKDIEQTDHFSIFCIHFLFHCSFMSLNNFVCCAPRKVSPHRTENNLIQDSLYVNSIDVVYFQFWPYIIPINMTFWYFLMYVCLQSLKCLHKKGEIKHRLSVPKCAIVYFIHWHFR